jgi:hypothetical protein
MNSSVRPKDAQDEECGDNQQSALSCSSGEGFTEELTLWNDYFSCQIYFCPTILKAIMKVPPRA